MDGPEGFAKWNESDRKIQIQYDFSVFALWCPLATLTVLLGFLLPWTWGSSSWPLPLAFNITVIQVYAPTSNAEEAEVEWFYKYLQDRLELTPKKDVLFIIGDWNAKVGSQETPGVTDKFGFGIRNEEGQTNTVLPRKCTGHSKHPLPTTQEKTLHMDITRWSTPKSDGLYSLQPKMEKLYQFSSVQ